MRGSTVEPRAPPPNRALEAPNHHHPVTDAALGGSAAQSGSMQGCEIRAARWHVAHMGAQVWLSKGATWPTASIRKFAQCSASANTHATNLPVRVRFCMISKVSHAASERFVPVRSELNCRQASRPIHKRIRRSPMSADDPGGDPTLRLLHSTVCTQLALAALLSLDVEHAPSDLHRELVLAWLVLSLTI